jgi:Cell division septal protein
MAARSQMPVMREARPKSRSKRSRRLGFLLMLFFITILLLLFFHSSFSRITLIEIEGNNHVTREEILEASGIELNDHFFMTTAETIRKRVVQIGIIEEASVTKKFPGYVHIEVKEYPEVAYEIGADGKLQVLLANGAALPLADSSVVIDKPILTGWEDQEMKKKLTETLAGISSELLTDISEIRHEPSPPAYPDKIIMYTRSYFQVETTIEKLPEKILVYRPIIENQLDQDVHGGIISLLEIDRFRPYPEPSQGEESSEEAQPTMDNP